MRRIIRILTVALFLTLSLGVSAQKPISRPKKDTPKQEQTAPAKKQKTKASKSSSPAAATYRKGQAAYNREDYAEAFRLYSEAPEQGNVDAIYDLASMYYMGRGVDYDY
jgi:TPR repeat protein